MGEGALLLMALGPQQGAASEKRNAKRKRVVRDSDESSPSSSSSSDETEEEEVRTNNPFFVPSSKRPHVEDLRADGTAEPRSAVEASSSGAHRSRNSFAKRMKFHFFKPSRRRRI